MNSNPKSYFPPAILSGETVASTKEISLCYEFVTKRVTQMVAQSKLLPQNSASFHTRGYHFSQFKNFRQFSIFGEISIQKRDVYPSITFYTKPMDSFNNGKAVISINFFGLLCDKDLETDLTALIKLRKEIGYVGTYFDLLKNTVDIKKNISVNNSIGDKSKAIHSAFKKGSPYHMLSSQITQEDIAFLKKAVQTSSQRFKANLSSFVPSDWKDRDKEREAELRGVEGQIDQLKTFKINDNKHL